MNAKVFNNFYVGFSLRASRLMSNKSLKILTTFTFRDSIALMMAILGLDSTTRYLISSRFTRLKKRSSLRKRRLGFDDRNPKVGWHFQIDTSKLFDLPDAFYKSHDMNNFSPSRVRAA
jgi:hypothetical protein